MIESEPPKIIVTEGLLKGKVVPLGSDSLGIGRDADNQIIILGDVKISRHHCRIFSHLGYYWLEDLKSTNGTFLTQAGNNEMQLTPFQPALMLDGAQVKVGLSRFELAGVKQEEDDIVQMLALQLQDLMQKIYERSSEMTPEERAVYENTVCDLREAIMGAQSEGDLVQHVAEKIQSLSAAFLSVDDQEVTVMFDPAFELPPMPDDLSQINHVARVNSLKNMFISDIQRCIPPDEDEANDANQ